MIIETNKDDDEKKVILANSSKQTPQEKQEQTLKYEILLESTNRSESNYFKYPPDLDMAFLHKEAYYLCPNKNIVEKFKLDSCPCCNKAINKKPIKWYWCDLYEEIVDDYGLTVPLYFTIIKFQLCILILVFCFYGIFFMIQVSDYCKKADEICDGIDSDYCDSCQFSGSYYILSIQLIKDLLELDSKKSGYFQFACFFVFFINLHLPFLYDLVISFMEIKYWHREPRFRQTETKTSIYIRHLQEKKQPQDIFDVIRAKIEKNPNYDISQHQDYSKLISPMFQEIIYLYDIDSLLKWQVEREQVLISIILLQKEIADKEQKNQLEELNNSKLKLNEQLKQLESLNQNINNEMGNLQFENQDSNIVSLEPLKFSKKAILRFTDPVVFKKVHENFKRTFFQDLCIKLRFIVHPKIQDKIAVKRSFRINGLFWNNIGKKTIDRIHEKLHSLVVMLLACAALMVAYEFIYLYVNDPEFNANKKQGKLNSVEKFATHIFTILVPIITTAAILVVIINQKKATRTTFAHLERGFMHFLIIVNYWLVTFVPYIFTFELWNGQNNVLAIYNLVSLTQNKLITKHVFHTLHVRYVGYLIRSRKVIKKFQNYFQGQLNQLLTPPFFPQRSRNCNALFALTISLNLIYICPVLVIMCFVFNLYIYLFDRYTITHLYAIDKRFTIILMRHQIKVYSIAFYPIKIYLFMTIFWGYKWLIYAGVPIGVSITLIGIIFRRKIIDFILLKCLKMLKKEPNYGIQENYSQSYLNYLKSLRIHESNTLADQILKGFQNS